MKTKIIFSTQNLNEDGGLTDCAGGTCPTIYETDRATYLVQGKILSHTEIAELSLPDGETVIEIPKAFLDGYKKQSL